MKENSINTSFDDKIELKKISFILMLKNKEKDFTNIDFSDIDICCVDLSNCSFTNCKFNNSVLNRINFSHSMFLNCNFGSAKMKTSNFYWAKFENCNINDVYFYGSDFTNCVFRRCEIKDCHYNQHTRFFALQCPEEGSFIGWKKAGRCIIKLLIPEDAKRSSATSRKCRCSKAKVLEIVDLISGNPIPAVESDHDNTFVYRVGETVEVRDFNEDRWEECAPGIHFFITRREAECYLGQSKIKFLTKYQN